MSRQGNQEGDGESVSSKDAPRPTVDLRSSADGDGSDPFRDSVLSGAEQFCTSGKYAPEGVNFACNYMSFQIFTGA